MDVILDETNLTRKGRNKWITIAKEVNPDIEIIFIEISTSIEECKARRKTDTKDTDTDWDAVITSMAANKNEVTEDEDFVSHIKV